MTLADAGMAWTVASVQVGVPQPIDTSRGTVDSSIVRRAVDGRVAVDREGVAGNAQANLVNHGGPDKAVCVYVVRHLDHWAGRLARELVGGAFGENLTIDGPDEAHACIGDTYRVGTALLQVSQPRQPCYKLSAVLGEERLVAWIVEHGSTGYYFRVVEAGEVWAGAGRVFNINSIAESSPYENKRKTSCDLVPDNVMRASVGQRRMTSREKATASPHCSAATLPGRPSNRCTASMPSSSQT